ncbi:hypothetical protein ACU8KG_24560 (plasmid) [Rhizobium leguminosarum]|jgi:hypothetical protein
MNRLMIDSFKIRACLMLGRFMRVSSKVLGTTGLPVDAKISHQIQ